MPTSTRFDLRALVREVFRTSQLTNDDELAKEVLSKIDKGDERDALEQAIPYVVRTMVSRDQRPLAIPHPTPPGDQTTNDTQALPVAGSPKPFRSRRIHLKRSHWEQQLRARVNVGHKARKFFGDCTREDLAFLTKHRQELAAANLATAKYLEALSRLMDELRVEFVRDLPEDAVTGLGESA